MLFARPSRTAHTLLDDTIEAASLPDEAIWLDLLDPTDAERVQAARICGFRIPTKADLDEIESTSRVRREGDILYLGLPLARHLEHRFVTSPVGLIVGPKRMVTIRYLDYQSFDIFSHEVETGSAVLSASDLLLGLLEAVVDRVADVLELTGADLERISADIFRSGSQQGRRQISDTLRSLMTRLGRSADAMSMIRDTLLGLSRILVFLDDVTRTAANPENAGRLKNLERDVRSLTDFDEHVTNKVQFLLDATLGFINIDQNNGIRVLTVVSLVGIPPTLIASIYGMNFKDIPELDWRFGYFYALGLMACSVVLPLLWFRWRRWI